MSDMKQILMAISAAIIALSGVAALIVWVVKQLIEKFLESKLEAFKSDLQMANLEHEVRFRRLDSKRAEIVATLYGLFVSMSDSARLYLSTEIGKRESSEKQGELLKQDLEAYKKYFEAHQIYLEKELCEMLIDLHSQIISAVSFHVFLGELNSPETGRPLTPSQLKEGMEIYKDFLKKLLATAEALEKEFRVILGVIKESPKASQ